MKLGFMCYGLSVCAHVAVALTCTVVPVQVAPAEPGGAAVAMQVSTGSHVSMPLLKPRPGVSEQGNPQAETDGDFPPAVVPESAQPGEMDGTPSARSDAPMPAAPPATEAPTPDAFAEHEIEAEVQAEARSIGEARPVREAPNPVAQARDTEPANVAPAPAFPPDLLDEAVAWMPVSPLWQQPPAQAQRSPRGTPEPALRADAPDAPPAELAEVPTPDSPVSDPADTTPQVADATPADDPTPPVASAEASPAQPAEPPDTPASANAEDDEHDGRALGEHEVDTPLRFDQQVRPTPSTLSRRHGEKGTVVVLIQVNAQGELVQIKVLDDSGHPRLLDAALHALRRSTFTPAIRDGSPVTSTRRIEYRF